MITYEEIMMVMFKKEAAFIWLKISQCFFFFTKKFNFEGKISANYLESMFSFRNMLLITYIF